MPSAYVLIDVSVTEPVQYERYKKLSSLAIEVHGAQVCVRGGAMEVLEGDWTPDRVVVLKFASVAAAKAWANSPEYSAARAARQGAADMRMVVVEGL